MSRCAGFLALLGSVALIPALVHGDPGTPKPRAAALDASGDPLPDAARLRLGTTRLRHGGQVMSVRYLPDGKTLISFGSDNKLYFWDAATGQELHHHYTPLGTIQAISSWEVQIQLNARLSISPTRQSITWVLSQDGRQLATLHDEDGIVIRDVRRDTATKRIPLEQGVVQFFAFAPSGRQIAAIVQLPIENGGSETAIKIWDSATGKELHSLTGPKPEQDGQLRFSPYTFAFSADGSRLLAVGTEFNGNNRVRLWDLKDPKESIRLVEHAGASNVVPLLAPDGKTLADVSANPITGGAARLRLWDAATGKQVRELAEMGNGASLLVFSPDGKTLASLANNQTLFFYDTASGKELFNLPGTGNVPVLLYSPDSKILALGSNDQTIRLLDARTGKEQHHFKGAQPYQANNGSEIPGAGSALAFSTDGATLAAASGTVVRRWSVATGKEQPLPGSGHEAGINVVVLSPDGKTIATGGQDGIRVWDAATGVCQRRWPEGDMKEVPPEAAISALAFAADGKSLLAGQFDGIIVRYDLASGKVAQEFKGHESTIAGLAVSASGKLIFSGSYDGRVLAWDTTTAKPVRQFAGAVPGGEAAAENVGRGLALLALAPDEATLAIVAPDGLRITETATAKVRRELHRPQSTTRPGFSRILRQQLDLMAFYSEAPSVVAFSPDGRLLALSAGSTIHLWDALRGKELRQVGGQYGSIRHMAFTPNGKVLAAASDGGSIRFWDAATGTVVAQVDGHGGGATGLAFSADGRTLISAGHDTTALIWDVQRCLESGVAASKLTARTAAAHWERLADADAVKAGAAVADLIDHPDLAVALLRERLQPVPALNQKRVAALLTDLEAGSFDARKKANDELEKLVELAEPALQGRLDENPPLEVKMRLERLLEKARGPVTTPEQARALRAVQALEQIGSAEARQVLERIAGGAAESRVTQSAKDALRRLAAVR